MSTFSRLTLTVTEVREATGMGRNQVYAAINSGKLRARKLGRKTLILKSDLEEFLQSLEPYQPRGLAQSPAAPPN